MQQGDGRDIGPRYVILFIYDVSYADGEYLDMVDGLFPPHATSSEKTESRAYGAERPLHFFGASTSIISSMYLLNSFDVKEYSGSSSLLYRPQPTSYRHGYGPIFCLHAHVPGGLARLHASETFQPRKPDCRRSHTCIRWFNAESVLGPKGTLRGAPPRI